MQIISTSFIPAFPCKTQSFHITFGSFQKKQVPVSWSSRIFKDENKYEEWNRYVQHSEGNRGRRCFFWFSLASSVSFTTFSASGKVKGKNLYDEKRLLEQNKRIQEANNAPEDFPKFIREGFQVKVVASDKYVKCDSGLIYLDIQVGQGRRIDSTYLQGRPAKIRVGMKALVPGFEEGIQDMRPGGKRRIIIPPELGPPVGPSTFFSSKQFEVFDVELLGVKDCQRRTIVFYSDVVCE